MEKTDTHHEVGRKTQLEKWGVAEGERVWAVLNSLGRHVSGGETWAHLLLPECSGAALHWAGAVEEQRVEPPGHGGGRVVDRCNRWVMKMPPAG